MSIRKKFENQIKKKHQEIERLESEKDEIDAQIREARAYLKGVEDMMKHLPNDALEEKPENTIRPGSKVALARDYLRQAGEAKYIGEILKGCGRESSLKNRQALSGQLSAYVRRDVVFSRTAPNTFGLIEWENSETNTAEQMELPDNFGQVDE